MSLEDCAAELSLWGAVVVQLIEDALDYHRLGPDRHGFREEAHIELNRPGPMLQRLCGLASVDPDTVLAAYQRRLGDMRPAMSGRCRPEKPLGIARAEKSPLFENNQIDLDALKIERKQGQRTDLATSSENSDEVKAKPIEVAAKKAGFGGYDTYRAAQKVIERDIPELVEAMARVPPRSPMDRVPLGLSD